MGQTDVVRVPGLAIAAGGLGLAAWAVRAGRPVPDAVGGRAAGARAAPAADAVQKEREQVARAFAGAETAAYYELLKERFKVKIKVPKPGAGTTPQQ